jgi:uncharacterized protein (TIGR02677 family)
MPRRSLTEPMTEANYLVEHEAGPYYRLLIRCFAERQQAHAPAVSETELLAHVQAVLPYDAENCHRHLRQLERWGLVALLPDAAKPDTLAALRQRPRHWRAERSALLLEELRAREEAAEGAASLDPTALDRLAEAVAGLVTWLQQDGLYRPDQEPTYHQWQGVWTAFDGFARQVTAYLDDLPRHRPKERLDWVAFLDYRDLMTRYLSTYIRRLYDRREQIAHLLEEVGRSPELLADQLAAFAVGQVRSDGTQPSFAEARIRFRREIEVLQDYFAAGGAAHRILGIAREWVAGVAKHARLLSEQRLGGTLREQTLLDLAVRFADAPSLDHAQALAQVVMATTPPLHWQGEAPEAPVGSAWSQQATPVDLSGARRGERVMRRAGQTVDRREEAYLRIQAENERRRLKALALAALFGPSGEIDLGELVVADGAQRQWLLSLGYRALSRRDRVGIGYQNWSVSARVQPERPLGELQAPDGTISLPHLILTLHRPEAEAAAAGETQAEGGER